ncbi:galactose-3-O-sulfotransferase 2-like isoform X2 [Liolophura sinensis]|uniref:galactose-3-O-sulfotransferase 2-like isoform X2 n=1 Tax=Liolophura sinensis TaxID=3198878 RepID=UPI003159782C
MKGISKKRQVCIFVSTCIAFFGFGIWREIYIITPMELPRIRHNVLDIRQTNRSNNIKVLSNNNGSHNNHGCKCNNNSTGAGDTVSENDTVKIYDQDNENNMKTSPCGPEVRHLAFVKVHKAGSTTVMNILERFAYKRNLLLALPQKANILHYGFSNIVPRPKNSPFDMLITHVDHYDRKLFASVLPADTKYIGIIREPLMLSISAFEYYHRNYGLYKNVPGKEKLREYLQHRAMYEPKQASMSYTNNRMSYDFGLPQKSFHDEAAIKKFLFQLDSEMDLVLVVEKFSESLVLLKRLMCWQLKDVLYITRNKNDQKDSVHFSADEMKYHRDFSLADNMLYDYFTNRLNEKLQAERNDFQEEVDLLKSMLPKVSSFCQKASSNNWKTTERLVFNKTKFNDVFQVDLKDCRLMLLRELTFVDLSRSKNLEIELLDMRNLPPSF